MNRLVLPLVCAGQFMVILDAAIVNVALPAVGDELGFSPAGLPWVVDAYLLTFAGLLLLGGRAADLFGHRRTLIAGLALFGAASLAGGLATGPGMLVAARAVQGAGAALLAPATLAVVTTAFTAPGARARALGAWSAAGGAGGTAGALAGGALTTGLSWRWVFLINVPIGAALIVAALLALPASGPVRRESLDLSGALTGTAGTAALIAGVMQSIEHGWSSARVVLPVLAGLALLAVFAAGQRRRGDRATVPPRLLRQRGVAVGATLLLLSGGTTIAMWYFTSLFLQQALGFSALQAGLGQTPAAVAFVVVARLTGGRTGTRRLIGAGCACFVAGFAWLAAAGTDGYLAGVLGPTLLIATGIGFTFPAMMAAATAGVEPRDAGVAGGLANTAAQVGASLGLAVLATAAGPDGGFAPVFALAAGLAAVIAAVSRLLPAPAAVAQASLCRYE